MIKRLPGEKDGGQTNVGGIVFHKLQWVYSTTSTCRHLRLVLKYPMKIKQFGLNEEI